MGKSEFPYRDLDFETYACVIEAFEIARKDRFFTEDEILKVLDWANRIVKGYAILGLIKEGEVVPDLNEHGEVFVKLT